jgi:DNA-binding NarL/FixJ family response regulator
MSDLKVMIVDDHTIFREGLRALLESVGGMAVVGEAGSGSEAVRIAAEAAPDVVLMDVHMPDMNGLEATRRLLARDARVGIVMLTMLDDDETVFAAMRAGARGYVLKGGGQEELLRAIDAVARGEAHYGAAIAARILEFFRASRSELPVEAFPDLTEREREVLDLIASGLGNAVIARRLDIAEKTVRNHVSNIFSKLQVTERAQAVVRAREAGYGRAGEHGGV